MQEQSGNKMSRIESDRFAISSAQMAGLLFRTYGWRWITGLLALFFFALIAAIIWDIRYLILGLMIIFVITPMILAALYFYYGLNQITVANVLPHRLVALPGEMQIEIFSPSDDSEKDFILKSTINLPSEKLGKFYVHSKGIRIPVKTKNKKKEGFIYFKTDSMEQGDIIDFLQLIYQ